MVEASRGFARQALAHTIPFLLDYKPHKYLGLRSQFISKQLFKMATPRRSTMPTDSGVSTPTLDHSSSSKLSSPTSQTTVPSPSTGKNPIIYLEGLISHSITQYQFLKYILVCVIPVKSPIWPRAEYAHWFEQIQVFLFNIQWHNINFWNIFLYVSYQ